jgi:hypothetical protein
MAPMNAASRLAWSAHALVARQFPETSPPHGWTPQLAPLPPPQLAVDAASSSAPTKTPMTVCVLVDIS